MATLFELEQFTEITSWNDIVGRAKYTPEIDPKITKVEEIIAAYVLKDEGVRCGLKDCHSPHAKGFLVRTSDDKEANIGWICGSKYFGADFNTLRNQYLRADRIRTHKRKLNEVLAQQEHYFARIAEFKKAEHGADWLYWSLQRFKSTYPKPIVVELEERARRDADVVEVTRERTKQEIDLAQAASPSANRESLRYETQVVGRLRGLYVFEHNIRDVLVVELENKLNELIGLDRDKATPRQLQEFYNWATSIEDLFADAELLISEGRVFFLRENLDLIRYFPMNNETREAFDNLTWDHNEGRAIERKSKGKNGR